jgi:hypothetical protein
MPATLEYERNRLARIERRKAEEAGPLANIRNIASQLLYGQNAKDKQRCKGDGGGSGSDYEPNDDEEADDADEVEKKRSRSQLYICQRKRYYVLVSYIVDNAFLSTMFRNVYISLLSHQTVGFSD